MPTSKKQLEKSKVVVCAFYKFTTLTDYEKLRQPIFEQLTKFDIRGSLLLANEGINGTLAGSAKDIDSFLNWLQIDSRFAGLEYKLSYHSNRPFHRTKVNLKQEIVTMGVADIDPNQLVGTYVEAQQWNELIADPETLVIDTRNEYEIDIGSFNNAINPHTETFREFPNYVQENLDPNKHKKIAMFCTGGIRCEKASAFMKKQGFDEVYHLQGGILKYLETVDKKDSLWHGECFVFDDRVAVNHDLEKGSYDQCHACRYPIQEEDKHHPQYMPGVSCARCYNSISEEAKQRFAEREKQVQLAKQRGEAHIGTDSQKAAEVNRLKKQQLKKLSREKRNSK